MTKIISIAHDKGGTGKTTTAFNIAGALSKLNHKVLLLDTDQQANLTSSFGISKILPKNFGTWLLGESTFNDTLISTYDANIQIIPSCKELVRDEREMLKLKESDFILKKKLEPVKGKYDFIIIDCPRGINTFSTNALVCSDCYIIPFEVSFYSLDNLGDLISFSNLVKSKINSKLFLAGILLTKYNESMRGNVYHEIAEKVRSTATGKKVFKTTIRQDIRLLESPMYGKTIMDFEPASNGSKDYTSLTNELLTIIL